MGCNKHPLGLPWWLSVKESACQCRRGSFNPWVRKIPWRRKWQPTSVFLPGKSHGQRSLAGYGLWGHKGVRHNLATEEQKHSLCIMGGGYTRVYKCIYTRCYMLSRDPVTPQTIASQAPPSLGFSRHEYWSGLPFPPPGDLP